MTTNVPSTSRPRKARTRWPSFSATVRPVSSRYRRMPAGIITVVTSDDSHSSGNWYVVPLKRDPNGMTCE